MQIDGIERQNERGNRDESKNWLLNQNKIRHGAGCSSDVENRSKEEPFWLGGYWWTDQKESKYNIWIRKAASDSENWFMQIRNFEFIEKRADRRWSSESGRWWPTSVFRTNRKDEADAVRRGQPIENDKLFVATQSSDASKRKSTAIQSARSPVRFA